MKNPKGIKLYDALFPLWMLIWLSSIFAPIVFLLVIAGNFVIDSIVLTAAMLILKIEDKFSFYKETILKIFLLGLVADFIGSALATIEIYILEVTVNLARMGDELYVCLPALFISALLIFIFDYKISFKDCDKKTKFRLALTYAIVTAPYTFLVPSSLLYG